MITKIETKEIMTVREMRKRYSTKWFKYVIIGELDTVNPDNEKGYVVFVADTDTELYNIPRDDDDHNSYCIFLGDDVEHPLEVGAIVYE